MWWGLCSNRVPALLNNCCLAHGGGWQCKHAGRGTCRIAEVGKGGGTPNAEAAKEAATPTMLVFKFKWFSFPRMQKVLLLGPPRPTHIILGLLFFF